MDLALLQYTKEGRASLTDNPAFRIMHARFISYAVKEVPQPQLPVAFGFVNVKPEPMTPVT